MLQIIEPNMKIWFFGPGCQLKHSRVDRCMSKEQVAFKFHECPDGDEEESRGNIYKHLTEI